MRDMQDFSPKTERDSLIDDELVHEEINIVEDRDSGLKAVIALHSTILGPAAGGCRRWKYSTMQHAIDDAKRLSEGMTFKNALAGVGFGGGKSVILADEHAKPTSAQLSKFAQHLNALNGRYITAEDVGMGVAQMLSMAEHSNYVSGIGANGYGGDPSPKTAQGVYMGIRAAAQYQFGVESLQGLRVIVQGLGSVGFALCEHLSSAGASLLVCDLNVERAKLAKDKFSASIISLHDVVTTEADIFAPCALGGVITEAVAQTIPVAMVAGAANNQLVNAVSGQILVQRGVQYVPDFVLNAGGVIGVAHEYNCRDFDEEQRRHEGTRWVQERMAQIPHRVVSILDNATKSCRTPDEVARLRAMDILASAQWAQSTHAA